jgi:hypothetical protein
MLQPRVTWVACGQQEGSKLPKVMTKENVMTGNKGVCTINNEEFGGEMYKHRNECPSVIRVAHEGQNFLGKLMKGGGPIGEFLYEVGEMKVGSQMGKLIVDEMEGS